MITATQFFAKFGISKEPSGILGKFFLFAALWNTCVFALSAAYLSQFWSLEVNLFFTKNITHQLLPVFISLFMWAVCDPKLRKGLLG